MFQDCLCLAIYVSGLFMFSNICCRIVSLCNCFVCCRIYFVTQATLGVHLKTKAHRRRVKELRFAPHTQDEADRAAGMGSFKMPTERIVRNLVVTDQMRDPAFTHLKRQQETIAIQANLNKKDGAPVKKKKPVMFIEVKSKIQMEQEKELEEN